MTREEIDEMNKEIIKDILKMMPTAYLLEALGVSTFEELTEPADRPHGEWQRFDDEHGYWIGCSNCKEYIPKDKYGNDMYTNYCPNCGAKMGGDGE